jgi:molecular chaperone DnaK (HSP70)
MGGVGLHEVTEKNFGIGVMDETDDPDIFSVLIPAQTPYPLAEPKRNRYMTASRKIVIPVYCGDKPKASENEYLGLVEYQLPQDAPSKTPVVVTFNYDRNRILTVGIEVEGRPDLNHHTTPKRYVPNPGLSDDQLRTSLRDSIQFVETVSEKYGEFFEPDQKHEIEKDLQNARQVLRQKEPKSIQKTLDTLTRTRDNFDVVTILHLSDVLMLNVDPKSSQFLAEQSKNLKDAYRTPRDLTRVKQIQKILEREILYIIDSTGESKTGINLSIAKTFLREMLGKPKESPGSKKTGEIND